MTIAAADQELPRPRVARNSLPVATLLFGTSIVLLLYFVALPIFGILWESLRTPEGYSLDNYIKFFTTGAMIRATVNTVLVSLVTGIGSVLIATPLAFGVARTRMRGKAMLRLAIIISFASPPFLMTLAYIFIAGPNVGYANLLIREIFGLATERGPLDIFTLPGFIVLALPNTVAFVFIIMLPAFANMDGAMEEASRIAGASRLRTILHITLPTMRAAMMAGGLLAFSTALAMFATPQMLGLDVLTVAMRRSIVINSDFHEASTIAAVSAVLSMSVLYLYRRTIAEGMRYQTITGKGFRPGLIDLGSGRHIFTGLAIFSSIFAAFLPYSLMALISFMKVPANGLAWSNMTFGSYVALYENPAVRASLFNSLFLGVTVATAIATLGFLLAYVVTKTSLRARALVDYLSILPLGIAGTAFAVGVIVINIETPARAMGLYATIWILFVAYVGRYIPFGVRAAQVALLQVSRELEEASRVSGAGQAGTLWYITLPLIKAGVAYAWILSFVNAFTEVSASAILTGARTQVAAVTLLNLWQSTGGLQKASALGVVMFVVTMVLVFAAQRWGAGSIVPDMGAGEDRTDVADAGGTSDTARAGH